VAKPAITLLLAGVLLAPGVARAQAAADAPSAPPLPETPGGPAPTVAAQTGSDKLAAPAPTDKPAAPPPADKSTVPLPTDRPAAPFQPPPPERPAPGRILPRLPHYVIRLSGGITFIGGDTFCNLFDSFICAAPSSPLAVWPIVDAEFELWWARSLYTDEETLIVEHGVSFGASVTFGHYFYQTANPLLSPSVNGTLWEPHFDVRWGLPGELFWRFALGLGIYIASATASAPAGSANANSTGAAFRIGLGVTILPHEPVSLAIDFVGEGGWIGNTTVFNAQLLIGPEVHFD